MADGILTPRSCVVNGTSRFDLTQFDASRRLVAGGQFMPVYKQYSYQYRAACMQHKGL